MMFLTANDLRELSRKLQDARRASGVGEGYWCPKEGEIPEGGQASDGTGYYLRTDLRANGKSKGVKAKLPVHGRSHLAIDPKTGKVVCVGCAKR